MSVRGGDRYDTVVVGAGPAGCTAAISILRGDPDARVALVDAKPFPRDKTCGDGLGPGVLRILDGLGLGHVLAGGVSPVGVRVVGPDGTVAAARGTFVDGRQLCGSVLRREVFDDRLVAEAELAGAEVLTARFTGTTLSDADRRVTVNAGGVARDLRTRVLVGADGANSTVRGAIGLPKPTDSARHIAIRAYCRLAPGGDGPTLEFDFARSLLPGYGWSFPVGDGMANIGVCIPLATVKARGLDLGQLLEAFVGSLRSRGQQVAGVQGIRAHHLPHSAGLSRMTAPRAVVIGDAAGTINALSGEGIYHGMRAGLELGRALGRELGPTDVQEQLERFERGYLEGMRRHFAGSLAAHRLLYVESFARLAVRAAAADRKLLDDAALALFDDGHLRTTTALRILRQLTRRARRDVSDGGAGRPATSPRR